jgi:hypothetical protein
LHKLPHASSSFPFSEERKNTTSQNQWSATHRFCGGGADFHVSLEVNLSFKRSAADAAAVVAVTNDPSAAKVSISEEDIRKIYPWDYAELTRRLQKRYIDFSANAKYHSIRKTLAQNPQFVKTRLLDPSKPSGLRKDFFNPNVVAEFDKLYTKKAGI